MAADGDMLGKIVLLSEDRHSALLRLFGSEQQIGDLLETAAHQPGEAQHFALLHGEGDVLDGPPADGLDPHIAALSDGVRPVGRLKSFKTLADDHLDELVLLGLGAHHGAGHPAVAQDGDAVGHGQGLVQVVGHEQDARPVRHAPADHVEQPVPVGPRQEDRRLVEDQEPASCVVVPGVLGQVIQCTDDGQQRPLDGGQLAHHGARIERQPELRERLLGVLPLLAPANEPARIPWRSSRRGSSPPP